MSYPITPSVYRNDNILAVSTPTYCEEVSDNWRYVFGIMVKAGYSVEIESALYVHNATTTEATIQDKGKSISGYYTYWADMPVAGDNQPDGITIYVNTPVIENEQYYLSALKGTGVREVAFSRVSDGSYFPVTYAKPGDSISLTIYYNDDTTPKTPYAVYIDQNGTTHQISLASGGENTYTFTMPHGNVNVATNAEASGGGGGVLLPLNTYTPGTVKYVGTFIDIMNTLVNNLPDIHGYDSDIADKFNDLDVRFPNAAKIINCYTYSSLGIIAAEVAARSSSQYHVVSINDNSPFSYSYTFIGLIYYSNDDGFLRYVNYTQSFTSDNFPLVPQNGYYLTETPLRFTNIAFGNQVISGDVIVSGSILVDYTLTPSSAGEIDGPETLESSADFSFTFTLNPGYQFKSCSALSVVRGVNNWNQLIPANTVVTSSGNVYTIAVSNLNEDLNGVNISINCINTNDPNDTPTTPTTSNTPQGGNGDHDPTSDVILPSDVPSLSAHDSGLITVFRPTLAQLQDLGNYLWTNITDFIENLQKWFSNPMDFIIALTVVPCIPDVGASRNVQIGLWETNISMPPVTSQWVTIDCGTIEVTNFYGSALDYSPYTKISAMLPFVGSVHLDTDEIMGKNVQLIYRIDIVSGHCVAMIVVDRSVLYQFSGECSANIPLTGADWSRVYGAIVNTAIGVATIAAAGTGMVAGAKAMDSAAKVDSTSRALDSLANVSTQMKGIAGVKEARELALQNVRNAQNIAGVGSGGAANAIRAQTLIHAVGNTVNSVMGAKVQAGHASSLTGNAGLIGTRKPYLLIEYPNQSLAEGYKHFMGYPSNVSGTIGSFSGYTVFEQVIPSIDCTDDELEEILNALKGGVYL